MKRTLTGVAALTGTLLLCGAFCAPTFAQQDPPAPPANTARVAGQRTAADVAMRIGKAVSMAVLADSTVAESLVPLPTEATTTANFEAQIDALVKALPKGATWGKLYLPVPKNGRAYNADAVAAYAVAQAGLFGSVGGDTAPGTLEILGQKVAVDRADPLVSTLNLKPVYLITNPSARAAGANASLTAGLQQWNAMTQEQQQNYAKQQAQQLLSMDPQSRGQMMQQQMSVMRSMMEQMTPEQRQQMFQNMPRGGGGFGGPGGGPGGRRGGGNRGGQ